MYELDDTETKWSDVMGFFIVLALILGIFTGGWLANQYPKKSDTRVIPEMQITITPERTDTLYIYKFE